MKFKELAKRPSKKKLVIVAIVVMGAVLLGWIGYSWYQSVTVNYAQEVAKPLEEALVRAGAIKMCTTGNSGQGLMNDNNQPWYEGYYELPQAREKAFDIINGIASQNGYKLTHASPSNRGFLGIPDNYISDWFFDDTSKTSKYSGLASGNVKLSFGVNNDGTHEISNISCGTKQAVVINSGEASSMITLNIKLPNYK
jgi:hypothetical protein